MQTEQPTTSDFEWNEANAGHIAWHSITTSEAEQVLLNDPLDLPAQIRDGEERMVQLGETDDGRILLVVTTWRRNKLRVVTAFPANPTMRRKYTEYLNYDEADSE